MRAWALLTLLAVPAAAQTPWGVAASTLAVSTTGAGLNPVYASSLGDPLPLTGGPWVLAEVLFFSQGRVASDYAWRDRVRARRGALYTSADLQGDVQELMALGKFDRVTPAMYGIPGTTVPAEYASISITTTSARVVFDVTEKVVVVSSAPRRATPPSAVSGVILTPTAYRGAGKHNTPGLGLDINAAYFIGRLYGANKFENSPRKTNYIDRIGLWTLTADGKMQVQSETPTRPAVAVGGQAMLVFRDSPQPTVTAPGVSVKVDAKKTKILTDGYFVASKNFRGVRTSLGVMQGNMGDIAAQLSEFMTPEAMRFYANQPPGTIIRSRTVPFGSVIYLIRPDYPVGFEVMKFNGSPLNPWLINFKIGRLFRLNFDVAYLKYKGGYDVLGLFQFRYNHFPRN